MTDSKTKTDRQHKGPTKIDAPHPLQKREKKYEKEYGFKQNEQ